MPPLNPAQSGLTLSGISSVCMARVTPVGDNVGDCLAVSLTTAVAASLSCAFAPPCVEDCQFSIKQAKI